MLQELHGLYQADDEAAAMEALDHVAPLYQDDPLPEFYKVVDKLLKWAPEIFASHRAGRISNGRLEDAGSGTPWPNGETARSAALLTRTARSGTGSWRTSRRTPVPP